MSNDNFGFLLLGLGASITGLVIVVYAILEYRKYNSRKGWPSVRGTIQTSTMKILWQSKGDGWAYTHNKANIEYQYQVGGKNYVANDPRFSPFIGNSEELVAEHPVGKEVDVFYNPKNPQDSRLKAYVKIDWLGHFIFLYIVPLVIFFALGTWLINMAFTTD